MKKGRPGQHRLDLYSGNAGIVIFLAALAQHTGESVWLDAACAGGDRLAHGLSIPASTRAGFIGGDLGVAFSLLALYRVTQDRLWLNRACPVLEKLEQRLPESNHDLLDGLAGILLALNHLYAAENDERIPGLIDTILKRFLEDARPGPTGFYWDRSKRDDHGLCGMAHGPSGIAFALLETAALFKHEGLYPLVEEALAFENNFYDPEVKNWRDNRKNLHLDDELERYKKAWLENDPYPFEASSDANAWCHGAAGIGLVRLRAWQLLGRKSFLDQVRAACGKVEETFHDKDIFRRYIYCHGHGGNADLLLEASLALDESSHHYLALTIAGEMLDYQQENKIYLSGYLHSEEEHPSLFLGNAGIGYFLLRCLDPKQTPSILAPTVSAWWPGAATAQAALSSTSDLERALFKSLMPRTMKLAELTAPGFLIRYFRDSHAAFQLERFAAWVDEEADSLPTYLKAPVRDICRLERQLITSERGIHHYGRLLAGEAVLLEKLQALEKVSDEDFLNCHFKASEQHQLVETGWHWGSTEDDAMKRNTDMPAGIHPVLISNTAKGVVETWLSELAALAVLVFSEALTVREGIQRMLDAFEAVPPAQIDAVKGMLLEQIQNAVAAGLLMPAESPQ